MSAVIRPAHPRIILPRNGHITKPRAGDKLPLAVPIRSRFANAGERAPNGEGFDVHIIAATARVARDHGIIRSTAWSRDLSLYRANPVVLWAHDDRMPPIAECVDLSVDPRDGNLNEWWRFHSGLTDDEHDRLATRVKVLYAVGGMRCASVSWLTHEVNDPTRADMEEARRLGEPEPWWVVTRAELLETSAVPVPSDPHATQVERALRDCSKKGIDMAPVRTAWDKSKRDLPSQVTEDPNASDEGEHPPAQGHDASQVNSYRCTRCRGEQVDGPPCRACGSQEMVAMRDGEESSVEAIEDATADLDDELEPGSGGTGAQAGSTSPNPHHAAKKGKKRVTVKPDHASGKAVTGDADPGSKAATGATILASDSTDFEASTPQAGDFGGSIQTLVFPKTHWPEGGFHIRYWATIRGFKHLNLVETADAYELPQRPEGDFEAGTLAWTCLTGAAYETPNDPDCMVRARIGSMAVSPDDPDSEGATPIAGSDTNQGATPLAGGGDTVHAVTGALPFKRSTVRLGIAAPWDPAAEVTAMEGAAALRARHAYLEPGADPAQRGSYRFPHHRASSDAAVVLRGCAASLARLGVTKMTAQDRAGVFRHLTGHYLQDFRREAPGQAQLERAVQAALAMENQQDHADVAGSYSAMAAFIRTHGATLKTLGGGNEALGAEIVTDEVERRRTLSGEGEFTGEEALAVLMDEANHDADAALEALSGSARAGGNPEPSDEDGDDEDTPLEGEALMRELEELAKRKPELVVATIERTVARVMQKHLGTLPKPRRPA